MNIALVQILVGTSHRTEKQGVFYTSYCMEQCIESYQYGGTYHLQFRMDAIHSLRKLRLSLLGNRQRFKTIQD